MLKVLTRQSVYGPSGQTPEASLELVLLAAQAQTATDKDALRSIQKEISAWPLWESPVETGEVLDQIEASVKDAADAGVDPRLKGGIELNAKKMGLDIATNGRKIEMKFDQAMIADFQKGDFSGVEGVILRIVPIRNPLLPGAGN